MSDLTSLNISLASFPGLKHHEALKLAIEQGPHEDPLFGVLSASNLQLVPQNFGVLSEEDALAIRETYPHHKFRLHANVSLAHHTRQVYDLSNASQHSAHFAYAARVSKALRAEGYTAHSGLRSASTLESTFDACRRLTQLFECPVGVEGQYPHPSSDYVLSTWDEYACLLDSPDVYYAIDLSHLNIVAHRSKKEEISLVKELLANPRCIEVHVSDNNGLGDQHQRCRRHRWWHDALEAIPDSTCVFYEGNLLRELAPKLA